MAFVLGLIFLVFAVRKATPTCRAGRAWRRRAACRCRLGAGARGRRRRSLYIPYVFDDLAFRVGNPDTIDVVMGTVLIVLAARGDAAHHGLAAAA